MINFRDYGHGHGHSHRHRPQQHRIKTHYKISAVNTDGIGLLGLLGLLSLLVGVILRESNKDSQDFLPKNVFFSKASSSSSRQQQRQQLQRQRRWREEVVEALLRTLLDLTRK